MLAHAIGKYLTTYSGRFLLDGAPQNLINSYVNVATYMKCVVLAMVEQFLFFVLYINIWTHFIFPSCLFCTTFR